MKLSTKGRYGMRIMLDLALQQKEERISVRDISQRQTISPVYLEQILTQLKAAGLVKSSAGPKGGFALTRKPCEITLKEIMESMEGAIALVDCVNDSASCSKTNICLTRNLWIVVKQAIDQALSVSLQDLIDGRFAQIDRPTSENLKCDNPVKLD